MKENNGMESIMWFKTRPNDREPSIFEIFHYNRLRVEELDSNNAPDIVSVYVLKSTSENLKRINGIELDRIAIIEGKDGNAIYSGKGIYDCEIRMSEGDQANPIYRYQTNYQKIGVYDLTKDEKLPKTSPISDIKIKPENRAKVQEMIDTGVLTLPDSKCIEFDIEPFSTQVKLVA